jgi:hypothetical protein
MEIHKPKPFHNWREFLAEIVVVVLGVLIALSACSTSVGRSAPCRPIMATASCPA